jgi:hypothetical protein
MFKSRRTSIRIRNFTCNLSWIQRFRERYNIKYGIVSGESANVDQSKTEDWIKNEWNKISVGYDSKDIYNRDEPGLFFKALHNNTLRFKEEKCHGGKLSKERLTVWVCSNCLGERNKLVVIGKSKNPRCFKNIKKLPVTYYNNRKAWMASEIWDLMLLSWDNKLTKINRRIPLLLDNYPAHPNINNKFSFIK